MFAAVSNTCCEPFLAETGCNDIATADDKIKGAEHTVVGIRVSEQARVPCLLVNAQTRQQKVGLQDVAGTCSVSCSSVDEIILCPNFPTDTGV